VVSVTVLQICCAVSCLLQVDKDWKVGTITAVVAGHVSSCSRSLNYRMAIILLFVITWPE
jgi:hypothetical protein